MIDKYYYGALTKTSNYDWQIHLHPTTILHGDDIAIIIDLIEQNLMDVIKKERQGYLTLIDEKLDGFPLHER